MRAFASRALGMASNGALHAEPMPGAIARRCRPRAAAVRRGTFLRCRPRISLLICGLFACLHFAPVPIASAEDLKQLGKSPAQDGQDERTTDKTRRDADGRLIIDGTVVDESGNPASKVRVRLIASAAEACTSLTDSKGYFRFQFVELPTARYLVFLAHNFKDRTQGYLHIYEEGTLGLPAPVKIVLKPAREFTVEINDQAGAPVNGAFVEISDLLQPLDEGRTGPNGTLQFMLPADAEIGTVIARKSGAGFDYWTSRVDRTAAPRPLPAKLSLTLNGARTVRVHASDSQGQPVAGVAVMPWLIMKQGRTNSANLSSSRSNFERAQTDSNGIVTIDWLPVDLVNSVPILADSSEYHLPMPPSLLADAKEGDVDLEMQLLRVTKISGTVFAADGRPAAGIVVQAEGRGETNHYFRDVARTNADGKFVFGAFPEQSYLISVLDQDWASASCTVAALSEDEPVSGLEFRLSRGTVLRGVATMADGNARVGATVTLVQTAELPAPAKHPDLVRWARTDAQGRYHFRIGPGTYSLYGPDHEQSIPLKIDKQPEEVRDFRADK